METILNINFFAFSSILTFISTFSIGVFVLLKGLNKRTNQLWAILCVFVSVWGIGSYKFSTVISKEEAFFWWRIATIGSIFIPITYYQFIYNFLKLKKKYLEYILLFVYILGFIYLTFDLFFPKNFIGDMRLVFNQMYFPNSFNYRNPVYFIFYVSFYWILLLFTFSLLIISYKDSKGVFRNQLKYVIVGSVIGWIGPHGIFFVIFKVVDIYPYSNFCIAIYPIIFTYGIFRYRLWDIHLIFKRTMAYSLSAGLLMGFFVVLVLVITNFISAFAEVDSFIISIFAALIIALLFNPLRNKIQMFIDKLFYKKTYDFYTIIRKVSHDLALMFDFRKIYSFVGDLIFSTLGLKNIYLLSAVPNGDYEVVYLRYFRKGENKIEKQDGRTKDEPKIEGNSLMFKLLRNSDDIVILDELPEIVEIIGQDTINNVTSNLVPFDGETIVPVFVDDKLELLFILGEKLSEDFFTDEDIKLLNTISHQTSIAIKNARLYAEKLRSEKFASMGIMSATFAHEIRNPLTSIKTFAQLIPEKYADTEFRETFSKIVIDEIGRIDGLIKELLSFSSKEAMPREQSLDVIVLIDETLENLKGRLELEKRNINVEKIYKKDKINISGDLKKLKQAFVNIVNNGCQAMDENGILKVNILPNGKFVDVIIADTGKGISSEDIVKIFDPFYTTRPMGVGLGLAISKKIIEDHGGRIEVESKLSEGTTFTISLPIGKN